ncbi:NAD-dependent epimerase/dehydratase family protein [Mesorhizobium sp. M1004]|uniref:NAD-dependent epimerase/dehydratase family protein n=1 Tax=Mesorhizobium sp. M1004 TaxID=2957046 RepID=UPI003339B968
MNHLVYASSSSIYGRSTRMPFAWPDSADHSLSLYAAIKKANELMAYTYSHQFALPTTGLRFSTVYGPWGRPDMALLIFAEAIVAGEPIDFFNHGNMQRDFTYVGDIVEGIVRAMRQPATPNPQWESVAGSSDQQRAVQNPQYRRQFASSAERLIAVLENALRLKANRNPMPLQPGDVPATFVDVSSLEEATGSRPDSNRGRSSPLCEWYREYYRV